MELLKNKYYTEYIQQLDLNIAEHFQNVASSNPEFPDFNFYIAGAATYSSNIEGNTVSFETFLKHKRFGGIAKEKEMEEIEHLISAYEFAMQTELSLQNFLVAHKMLSQNILIKSKQGKIREEKVGVFGEHGLVYLAIEPELVQSEMEKLFLDINQLLQSELSIEQTFYFASMLHLVFVKIHPFMDGNGRAARLLEKWFLASLLSEKCWNIESEKYYFKNRSDYYANVHIGVNYHELNYNKSVPFLLMLPKSLMQ